MVELVARLGVDRPQDDSPSRENGFNSVFRLVASIAGSPAGRCEPTCDGPAPMPLVACDPGSLPISRDEFNEFLEGMVALVAAYQQSALLDMMIQAQLSSLDSYLGAMRYNDTQRQINELRDEMNYIYYGLAY